MSRMSRLGGILTAVMAALAAMAYVAQDPLDRSHAAAPRAGPRLPVHVEIPGEPLQPLPLVLDIDARKVALGRALFHDVRLSRDDTVACASCHRADRGGADDVPFSTGVGGARTAVNVPTVHNSGFSLAQFWDGRAATLEDQIDGPLQHPDEMGSTWPQVLAKLGLDPGYVAAVRSIYGGPLSVPIVKDAIAAYERSLVSRGARFDAYLRGQVGALSAEEKAGYALFKDYGCASCHQGVNVGGNMFQRLGLFADYFADRGTGTEADLGRFNVTRLVSDRHVFKVPSLRDVELTAPYFHDGSANSLEEAVAVMARYQLGRYMSGEDVRLIVAFLRTLTGRPEAAAGD
jgi:cytochrome c peroxidase